jgi:hypothetical protein
MGGDGVCDDGVVCVYVAVLIVVVAVWVCVDEEGRKKGVVRMCE